MTNDEGMTNSQMPKGVHPSNHPRARVKQLPHHDNFVASSLQDSAGLGCCPTAGYQSKQWNSKQYRGQPEREAHGLICTTSGTEVKIADESHPSGTKQLPYCPPGRHALQTLLMEPKTFLSARRLALVFIAAVPLALASARAAESPDLLGVIKSAAGAPVAGASVFIYTAGPRVGPGDI